MLVRDPGGRESVLHAFAVVDASGVYGSPNWAGTGGIPARGETYLAPQMSYRCDDFAGLKRARHAGRRTLVIGGGASAATTVGALAGLAAVGAGHAAWSGRRGRTPRRLRRTRRTTRCRRAARCWRPRRRFARARTRP